MGGHRAACRRREMLSNALLYRARARASHCYPRGPREVSACARVNIGCGIFTSGVYGGILFCCICIYPQIFSVTLDSFWRVFSSDNITSSPQTVSSFLLQLFSRPLLSQCDSVREESRDTGSLNQGPLHIRTETIWPKFQNLKC